MSAPAPCNLTPVSLTACLKVSPVTLTLFPGPLKILNAVETGSEELDVSRRQHFQIRKHRDHQQQI